MSKKVGSEDGRKNNRPPEHSKIKPEEIRNPHGRRGKPPPALELVPVIQTLSDRFLLAESKRIVSHDEKGPVTAHQRLMQEWHHDALFSNDPKVRESLLRHIAAAEARHRDAEQKELRWFLEAKAHWEKEFADAYRRRRPPPDVPHPAHINLAGEDLAITGPLEPAAREWWEEQKSYIKICSWLHARARQKFQADRSEPNRLELNRLMVHRRRLMRPVPKGWNWQEEIYCRYSRSDFVRDTIASLNALR